MGKESSERESFIAVIIVLVSISWALDWFSSLIKNQSESLVKRMEMNENARLQNKVKNIIAEEQNNQRITINSNKIDYSQQKKNPLQNKPIQVKLVKNIIAEEQINQENAINSNEIDYSQKNNSLENSINQIHMTGQEPHIQMNASEPHEQDSHIHEPDSQIHEPEPHDITDYFSNHDYSMNGSLLM